MKKKLNILILSPRALENGRGGEISSMELAAGLQKYFNVTFFDTNRLFGKKLLSKEVINERLKDIKTKGRLRLLNLKIFGRQFGIPNPFDLIRFFNKIKENDIIYYSTSTVQFDLIFMIFSLVHRQAKFVVGYRKPLHSDKLFSLYNIRYRLSILFYSLFKKRIYHHTLSYNAKKFLEQFYDPNKVKFVVHGIDLNKFSDDALQMKNERFLNFIYIGYLDDVHKGVNVLVEGIKRFLEINNDPKVFFEFCGMGPLESKIKDLEEEYPKFIKFNGYVSNELVPDYYKKSDVFLFSSRVEPFPRSIMEALGANLLVLCTKTIGSIELLQGKKFAFFVNELNSEAIKNKILEIYQFWKKNPEDFKRLQVKAKEFVFQNYSSSIELEMFKEFFDNISRI